MKSRAGDVDATCPFQLAHPRARRSGWAVRPAHWASDARDAKWGPTPVRCGLQKERRGPTAARRTRETGHFRVAGQQILDVRTGDVLARLQRGDPDWESAVPEQVAAIIKERRLLGCGT